LKYLRSTTQRTIINRKLLDLTSKAPLTFVLLYFFWYRGLCFNIIFFFNLIKWLSQIYSIWSNSKWNKEATRNMKQYFSTFFLQYIFWNLNSLKEIKNKILQIKQFEFLFWKKNLNEEKNYLYWYRNFSIIVHFLLSIYSLFLFMRLWCIRFQ